MENTTLPKDFREFLQLLNANHVEYLVVGGFAVGLHGYPRATSDIDIWISTDQENSLKIAKSLVEFGFAASSIDAKRFTFADQIFQIGRAPIRIDLLTSIPGVEFEACVARSEKYILDEITIRAINLEDLRTNKLASGRSKDLDDLENLPQ
ncbi:nucleotidyltransferase [Adhaeretor mobilis]|uniref:Uncharacterized protein n=1 Tax=Adhaeretor mobilis TaxID=1930276 RepID=A0A517N244_9BACT|nr:nucleotidyltransferase [Adhaeretor mobilis]QDT01207.1 hypothetical protein HG15A2_45490 [Adhaeretor mobilis]